MDIKNVGIRSVSGLVYIALIVFMIWLGSAGVALLSGLFALLASVELNKLTEDPGGKLKEPPIFALDAAICVCIAVSGFSMMWLWLVPVAIFLVMLRMILFIYSRSQNSLSFLMQSLMQYVYIAMPLCCLSALGTLLDVNNTVGVWGILAIFIMIWVNDTGAFIVGSMLGRHKLIERVSPKKTWEGFFGGLLFCIGAAALMGGLWSQIFALPLSLVQWIILGALVAVFATWGDLIESQIKRSLGKKDSGNLIPGHGGILDRIDSVLLVMPMTLLYIIPIYLLGNNAFPGLL